MDTRLFDALNTGIILLDTNHRAIWVNESARRITSMGLRQLASVPFESWVTVSQSLELAQSLKHLVHTLYGFTYENWCLYATNIRSRPMRPLAVSTLPWATQ